MEISSIGQSYSCPVSLLTVLCDVLAKLLLLAVVLPAVESAGCQCKIPSAGWCRGCQAGELVRTPPRVGPRLVICFLQDNTLGD